VAAVPWLLPSHYLGNLFVGFYIWNASYIVMSGGCVLHALGYSLNSRQ
jgi:hypothetical protein